MAAIKLETGYSIGIPTEIKEIRGLPTLTQQVVFSNDYYPFVEVYERVIDPETGCFKRRRFALRDAGDHLEPGLEILPPLAGETIHLRCSEWWDKVRHIGCYAEEYVTCLFDELDVDQQAKVLRVFLAARTR